MVDYFDLTQDVENGEVYSASDLLDQQNIIITSGRLLPDLYVGIKSLATNVSTHFSLTLPDFSSVPSTISFSTPNVIENDTVSYFEDLESAINSFKDMLDVVKDNWLNIYKSYLNEKTPDDNIGDLILSLDETGFPTDFNPTHISYDLSNNEVIDDVEMNSIHSHLLNLLKTAKYVFGILYDTKVDNSLTIASMPNVTITAKQLDTTNLISSPSTNTPTIDGTIYHSVRCASYPNATTYIWTPSGDDRHKYGIYNHDTSEWEVLTDTYTAQEFPTISDSEVEDLVNDANYNYITDSYTHNFIVYRSSSLYYITLRMCAIDYSESPNHQEISYYLKYNKINITTGTTESKLTQTTVEYENYVSYNIQSSLNNFNLNYKDNFVQTSYFQERDEDRSYYRGYLDSLGFSSLGELSRVSSYFGDDLIGVVSASKLFVTTSGILAYKFIVTRDEADGPDDEQYYGYTIYALGSTNYLSSGLSVSSESLQNVVFNPLNFYDASTLWYCDDYYRDDIDFNKDGFTYVYRVFDVDNYGSYSRDAYVSSGYSMKYSFPVGSVAYTYNEVLQTSYNLRFDYTNKTSLSSNRTSNFTTTYDFYKPNTFPHYFVYQRDNLSPYVYENTVDVSSITEDYITFCPRLNDGWYHTISSEKNDEINKQTDTIKYYVNFYGNTAEKLTNYNIYLLSWD